MSEKNPTMGWILFLDDERIPATSNAKHILENMNNIHIARTSDEALELVKCMGMPKFISFDHDLGDSDTSMVFLKRLVNELWDEADSIPAYFVHSANPVGKLNIQSFMQTWMKVHDER